MRTPTNDRLTAAAVDLLADHPELTNAELLRHLAARLGPQVLREVPVNRVQRHIREPALVLLREHRRNGLPVDGSGGIPGFPRRARVPSLTRRNGEGTTHSAPRAPAGEREGVRNAVDEALLEAFRIGATAESFGDVVDGFRQLDRVRHRMKALLGGAD